MCNLGEQIRLHWQWKGWWGNCNERILRRKFVLQVHICLLLFSLPKYSLWHWLWIKFLDFSLVCVPVKCSYVQFLSNWMLLTTLISSWIWTDVMNLNCRWLWKGIFFCVCVLKTMGKTMGFHCSLIQSLPACQSFVWFSAADHTSARQYRLSRGLLVVYSVWY